mmetsp:Transcript_7694/g.18584  ORF Transcript_7694/g.18584 Transcript_7694/m.18584 type:complete len:679 (-) Transcript_7694:167-2203(-)
MIHHGKMSKTVDLARRLQGLTSRLESVSVAGGEDSSLDVKELDGIVAEISTLQTTGSDDDMGGLSNLVRGFQEKSEKLCDDIIDRLLLPVCREPFPDKSGEELKDCILSDEWQATLQKGFKHLPKGKRPHKDAVLEKLERFGKQRDAMTALRSAVGVLVAASERGRAEKFHEEERRKGRADKVAARKKRRVRGKKEGTSAGTSGEDVTSDAPDTPRPPSASDGRRTDLSSSKIKQVSASLQRQPTSAEFPKSVASSSQPASAVASGLADADVGAGFDAKGSPRLRGPPVSGAWVGLEDADPGSQPSSAPVERLSHSEFLLQQPTSGEVPGSGYPPVEVAVSEHQSTVFPTAAPSSSVAAAEGGQGSLLVPPAAAESGAVLPLEFQIGSTEPGNNDSPPTSPDDLLPGLESGTGVAVHFCVLWRNTREEAQKREEVAARRSAMRRSQLDALLAVSPKGQTKGKNNVGAKGFLGGKGAMWKGKGKKAGMSKGKAGPGAPPMMYYPEDGPEDQDVGLEAGPESAIQGTGKGGRRANVTNTIAHLVNSRSPVITPSSQGRPVPMLFSPEGPPAGKGSKRGAAAGPKGSAGVQSEEQPGFAGRAWATVKDGWTTSWNLATSCCKKEEPTSKGAASKGAASKEPAGPAGVEVETKEAPAFNWTLVGVFGFIAILYLVLMPKGRI